MRIRTVKPEFWSHEKMSAAKAETALLALALLNYADDEGYFNAHPRLVEAALMPLRALSVKVPVILKELSSLGWIEVRTIGEGKQIGRVINFLKHQRVEKPRKSLLRSQFESSDTHPVLLHDASGITPGGNGMEQGTGNREQGTGTRGRAGGGKVPAEQPEPIAARMLAINELKNRKAGTHWTANEYLAFTDAGLAQLQDPDFADQFTPLASYYGAEPALLREFWKTEKPGADFRRRDLLTLLHNWPGEVDRAREWCGWLAKKNEEQGRGRL